MTRNFDVRRSNTREPKVHLDPGWDGENLSFLERVEREDVEGDTPPIDDPSYDFINELSGGVKRNKRRYIP